MRRQTADGVGAWGAPSLPARRILVWELYVVCRNGDGGLWGVIRGADRKRRITRGGVGEEGGGRRPKEVLYRVWFKSQADIGRAGGIVFLLNG